MCAGVRSTSAHPCAHTPVPTCPSTCDVLRVCACHCAHVVHVCLCVCTGVCTSVYAHPPVCLWLFFRLPLPCVCVCGPCVGACREAACVHGHAWVVPAGGVNGGAWGPDRQHVSVSGDKSPHRQHPRTPHSSVLWVRVGASALINAVSAHPPTLPA